MSFETFIAIVGAAWILWFFVIAPCFPEREDQQLVAVAGAAHLDAQAWADLEIQAEEEEDRIARKAAKRERKARLAGDLAAACWPLMQTDGSPSANRRGALAAEAYDYLIDVSVEY